MQCTSPGEVAITIDDGTQPSQAGLAKLFEDNGFRGTFFTNGKCPLDDRDATCAGEEHGHGAIMTTQGMAVLTYNAYVTHRL